MWEKYNQDIISHIELALKEDVGQADHSSLSCIEKTTIDKAKLVAKQDCIICGIDVARKVYNQVDESVKFTALKKDGDKVKTIDGWYLDKDYTISIDTLTEYPSYDIELYAKTKCNFNSYFLLSIFN